MIRNQDAINFNTQVSVKSIEIVVLKLWNNLICMISC